MTYSIEERAAILARAREAIEAVEASLDAPRPEADLPPVEDRVARWRREANEQAARVAEERAKPWPLTEWEVAQLQRDKLSGMIEQQRDFMLRLLAEVVAEVRSEFEQKVAALEDQLGQVRAELTIAKAFNNKKSEPSGEVVDLRKTA